MIIEKEEMLASRESKKENTVIELDGVRIGGKDIVVMAGPCAVESEEQIIETAKAVKNAIIFASKDILRKVNMSIENNIGINE